MINRQKEDGEMLYWLTCDHCEDFTLQYHTRAELAEATMDDGWRYNTTLQKHFCTLACELEALAKLSKEGGSDD